MKAFLVLLASLFVAGSVRGQSTTDNQGFTTKIPNWANHTLSLEPREKPNVLPGGSVTYSGIAVQTVKTDNPLQLVNPLAPARYGDGRDNASYDIFTGRETGLKFFSIDF